MMSSLFEVYDPFTFFLNLSLSWMVFSFLTVFFSGKLSCGGGSFSLLKKRLCFLIEHEFSGFFSFKLVKKTGILLFVSLFLYILTINLLGLVPYAFSISSHMVFAISLSFPLWLGFMLLSWIKFTNSMFAHLIPLGTPVVLIPLMVLIETVSNIIRPWSLSVRLMANMISGHLLMSLLGDCGWPVFLVQVMLFLFEFFVCFIQAYVFSALLTLYSSEV